MVLALFDSVIPQGISCLHGRSGSGTGRHGGEWSWELLSLSLKGQCRAGKEVVERPAEILSVLFSEEGCPSRLEASAW